MPLAFFILFIISYFLHLTARFPVLGAIRFDMVLGTVALAAVVLQPRRDIFRWNETTSRRLSLFLLYIVVSLPLVTWPGSVVRFHLADWIKVAFFFVLTVGVADSEKKLKWLMFVFLCCQVFRTLEPLYLHVTTGYWGDVAYSHVGGSMTFLNRLSGAPHDVVNPNQLAWVIVTTVPFLFYLLWMGNGWQKLLFGVLLPPAVYCLLLTGSRSGLLSLAFTLFAIILMGKRKARNFFIALAIVFPAALVLFGGLAPDLKTRYQSLIDSGVPGADTVHGRVNALFVQIGSIANNPLFGNGLGTSGETNSNVLGTSSQITHNLYIEILQESGIIGFSLFMAVIVSMVQSLREAKKILLEKGEDGNSWLFRLITATQVWVLMDLFYSFSCFGLRSWEWYFFGGVTTVCLGLAKERDFQITSYHSEKSY